MDIRTRQELFRAGWSRSQLSADLRDGRLLRLARGHYVTPRESSPRDSHLLLLAALTDTLAPTAVLSHGSAAALHGLAVPRHTMKTVHVTRSGGTHGRTSTNVHVHVAPLAESDVTAINSLACTSLTRTACDLIRTLDYAWGVVIADHALRLGASRSELAPDAGRRRRGDPRLRSVVAFADVRAASPLESRSRALIAEAGLPAPELQLVVRGPNGWFAECDFAWREYRLIGEADGKVKYGELLRPGESAADAVMAEKAREQRIRDEGWRVVRWSWAECNDGTMVRRIRRALEAEGWRPTLRARRTDSRSPY